MVELPEKELFLLHRAALLQEVLVEASRKGREAAREVADLIVSPGKGGYRALGDGIPGERLDG